ncbi:MAG: ribulose-phosphate 3-epimerase [Deltaproteobacteria bacterium]
MSMRIAPSILSADFSRLGDEVRALEAAGADVIHVDVMDGRFVPNITIGPSVVSSIRKVTDLPLDVHLMIEDPDRYLEAFAEAGASWISVHVETCIHIHRTLLRIRDLGALAGAVLNPGTSPLTLEYILDDLDFVLIMGVNPGFGGQRFIPSSIAKIRAVKEMIFRRGLGVSIEVDGGISSETIQEVAKAGADVCVAGSAILGAGDYVDAIKRLKALASKR